MSQRLLSAFNRRRFLSAATALGAGSLLLSPGRVKAEPAPEISRIRIHENPLTCIAPQIVARDHLYAEGFTDVQYVDYLKDTPRWPPEDILAGEVDITFSFTPTDIQAIDRRAPLVILGAAHTGCVELVASQRVRSTRDLKGKTIGISTDTKVFISMFAAYVGLDPDRDISWTYYPWGDWEPLFEQGKIDAFMCTPPLSIRMRDRKNAHTLVHTSIDKPWSQYSCCLLASSREFVSRYPIATKRALRALFKSVDLCVQNPERVARYIANRGLGSYEMTLQGLREIPYAGWRHIDVADSVRFWSLRLHDVGAIRSSPQEIIARGTELRFLDELKRELKA